MPDHLIEIVDNERAKVFEEIFGSKVVKVTSSTLQELVLPNGDVVKAYYLDLTTITTEQREKLVTYLSQAFNFSRAEVDEKLEDLGVPILEKNCILRE